MYSISIHERNVLCQNTDLVLEIQTLEVLHTMHYSIQFLTSFNNVIFGTTSLKKHYNQ